MRKTTLLFSLVAIPFFIGCAKPDIKNQQLSDSELNISKDSVIVEQENLKSAVAILIKKSEQGNREAAEAKALSNLNRDSVQQLAQQIKQLNSRIDEIFVKISMTSDDIMALRGSLSSLKSSGVENNNTGTIQTSKAASTNAIAIVTAPILVNKKIEKGVDISSIMTNKTSTNKTIITPLKDADVISNESNKRTKHALGKKRLGKKSLSNKCGTRDKTKSGKKKLTSNYEKRMKLAVNKKA